jgi:hypothetical protein
MCDSSLRSLGIAAPGRSPILLYQQAARFALRMANQGKLLGASPRADVKSGDLYLIDTTEGTFALVRELKSTGSAGAVSGPRRCEDYTSDNYPYTLIPPGLVRIWLRLAGREWVWPVLDSSTISETRSFAFIGQVSGEIVAHATCASDIDCRASLNGRPFPTPLPLTVSLEAVQRIAGR